MSKLQQYLSEQISEIENNRDLRWYGFFLGLSHIITVYFWMSEFSQMWNTKASLISPACWPFFSSCDILQFQSSTPLVFVYLIYFLLAIPATLLFLKRSQIRNAFVFLSLATLIKAIIISTRYIYLGNYHYMPFLATIAFLFVPDKKRLLPLLIVSFYIAAGMLKFNLEWLSGAVLYVPFPFKGSLMSAALFYVVLYECFIVLGLLAKNKWVRILTLIQVAAFHTISGYFVGYFYPLSMACLLSIFVLTLRDWDSSYLDDFFQIRLQRSTYIFLGVFFIAQLVPKTASKDPSLGGLMRIPAETMYDSKAQCYYQLLHYDEKSVQELKPFDTAKAVRIHCDPIMYLSQMRRICLDDPTGKYDFALYTKKTTDTVYLPVIDIQNVCSQKYNLLWAEMHQERN